MMAPEQVLQPAHVASISDNKRKVQCISTNVSESKKPCEPAATTNGARSNTSERLTELSGIAPISAIGSMRRCSMCSTMTSSMIELSDISDTACCVKCIPSFWKAEYETRCKINATHKSTVIPSASDLSGPSAIHSQAHIPLTQGLHKIHPSILLPPRTASPTETTASQKLNSPTESSLHPSSSAWTHTTNTSIPATGTAAATPADSSVPCSPAAPHNYQQSKELAVAPASAATTLDAQQSRPAVCGHAAQAPAPCCPALSAAVPSVSIACTPNSKLRVASVPDSSHLTGLAGAAAEVVVPTAAAAVPPHLLSTPPHTQLVTQARRTFWDSPVRDYILNRSAPVVEVMMDENDDGCLLTVRLGSAAVMLHSAVKLWRAGMAWPS